MDSTWRECDGERSLDADDAWDERDNTSSRLFCDSGPVGDASICVVDEGGAGTTDG